MAYEDYSSSDGGTSASNGVSNPAVPGPIQSALKPKPRRPMSAAAAQSVSQDDIDYYRDHPAYGPLEDSEDYSQTGDSPAPYAPEIGPPALGQRPMSAAVSSPSSKGTPADSGLAPSASDVSSGVGNLPGTESGPPPLIMDAASEPQPKLAEGNKFFSLLGQITGMRGPQPAPGQPYQGPETTAEKIGGLGRFLGRLSESYENNFGTPLDREEILRRHEIENEAAWRMANLREMENWHGTQGGINQEKADTQQDLASARIPLFGAQANEAAAKTDKTRYEVEQLQQGLFPVDPITAQLVNRPDLAGKSVSTQLWTAFGRVLSARGLKAMDLGNDGYWLVDRAGNKINQISAVGPSVARAIATNQNRPVQVIDSRGNLVYSTAGQAISNGYAPAGPGAAAMGKNAQLTDIYSGIGSMKVAIVGLPNDEFSTAQLAKLQAILREPDDSLRATLWTNFVGSENLAPGEQDFVVALQQLRERALSVRNLAAMGVGSDAQRAQVLNSLPGILSGNKTMMLKQLNAFANFVDNLATGVPHVGASGGMTPIHSAVQSRASGAGSKVDELVRKYGR